MKDKKFMDQKAKDMSIKELCKAINLKSKDEPKEPEEKLSIEEEINKYPKRFETLNGDFKWVQARDWNGSYKVLNAQWNYYDLNDNVFYVEIHGKFKELIRRKGVFK